MKQYASFIKWIHSEQGIDAHAWAVAHAFDVKFIGMKKTENLINALWRSHLALRANQLRAKSVERLKEVGVEQFHKESKKLRNAIDNNSLATSGLPGVEDYIAELDKRIESTRDLDNRLSRSLAEVDYPSSGRPRDLATTVALDAWQVLGAEYSMRRCARDTVAFIGNIGALGGQDRDDMADKFYAAIQRLNAEGR